MGTLTSALPLLVSISTLIGFGFYLFKEAVAKGRLYQRIDDMEKNINKLDCKLIITDNKTASHDGDLIKVAADIESLRDLMERMDKKLDRIMERKNYE